MPGENLTTNYVLGQCTDQPAYSPRSLLDELTDPCSEVSGVLARAERGLLDTK